MKIKKSIVRVEYPYAFSKEEYISDLSKSFQSAYPQFLLEQITAPISIVTNIITSKLNYDKSYNGIMLYTGIFKNLEKKYVITDVRLSQSLLEILSFLNGMEDSIRYYITDLSKIVFPEERAAEYIKFFTEVTKKVRDDICSATEAKIPQTAKIEYQRWLDERRSASEAASESAPSTFTGKLGKENTALQEKKSFVSMIQEEHGVETSSSVRKKARVTFEDESLKKDDFLGRS